MSAGQKGRERAVFSLPRASLTENRGFSRLRPGNPGLPGPDVKGFTLVETLVAALILGIITAALVMVLNVGNFSNSLSSAKLSAQQEARNAIDWIIKDARQTAAYQISNNDPTANHIKFRVCIGHDGSDLLWSSNFIEYTYDPATRILTRSDSGTGRTWQFADVAASPFDISRLVQSVLVVTIDVQKQAPGAQGAGVSITEEIRIRNG